MRPKLWHWWHWRLHHNMLEIWTEELDYEIVQVISWLTQYECGCGAVYIFDTPSHINNRLTDLA